MASSDSYFVVRTMQALEATTFQPCTAPQVAELLRVDARTARRLLNRLVDDEWLLRSDGRARTYTLSLRLTALVSHFLAREPLIQSARSVVDELHEATGATAYVAAPSYRSVVCLAQRSSCFHDRPQLLDLVPAHAIAAGKVLLALRPPWRDSVLERPLERLTAHTIVTPEAVRDECEATLDRGFASEDGELHDELHSIAVPVPDRSGDVMIAIGITDTRRKNVAKHLTTIEAAARRLRDSCDH